MKDMKEFAMTNTCAGVLYLTTQAHLLGAAFAMKHGFVDLQGAGAGAGGNAAQSEAVTASMAPITQLSRAQKKDDAAADVI